jgi:hypothetical protein
MASDMAAFVKIMIPGAGGAVTGPVSHNTATKLSAAAQPPIAHVIHRRTRPNDLAVFLLRNCGFFNAA